MNIFKRKKKEQIAPEQREFQYNSLFANGGLRFGTLANTNNLPSMTLSGVYSAVELISNSIAQLPIHITKDIDGGTEIVYDHPIECVFYNGLVSKFTLFKQMIKDMYINGNGYAYIQRDGSGLPVSLQYLESKDVSPQYFKETGELYYLVSGHKKLNKVLPKDIIHIFKTSLDGIQGKGLMYYAFRTLDIAHATDNAASEFFSNGCNINGIISVKTTLTDKQKEDIRQNWQQTHSGKGSGGIAVLPGNMDYTQTGSNASDAQMLESRLYNVEEIARFFNVSPTLLGDLSKSSYNTLEQSQMEFLIHCLQPIICMFETELNRKLFTGDRKFKVDLDETYLIRADKNTMSNYLGNLVKSGIISINEARRILGFNVKEGCDDLIIPFTDVNANKINGDNNDITE